MCEPRAIEISALRLRESPTYHYNTVPNNTVHRTDTMFIYYMGPRSSVDSPIDTTIMVIYTVVIHVVDRVRWEGGQAPDHVRLGARNRATVPQPRWPGTGQAC